MALMSHTRLPRNGLRQVSRCFSGSRRKFTSSRVQLQDTENVASPTSSNTDANSSSRVVEANQSFRTTQPKRLWRGYGVPGIPNNAKDPRPRRQRPEHQNQPMPSVVDAGAKRQPTRSEHNIVRNPIEVPEVENVLNQVGTFVDGKPQVFSPILLRDLCTCTSCMDPSSKQKLFSTADIPLDLKARAVATGTDSISIAWENDVPGYGEGHATVIDLAILRSLIDIGNSPNTAMEGYQPGRQTIWDAQQCQQLLDMSYEAYMEDDATLFQALRQLHTHGILFLGGVPNEENSVATIAKRIGPVKNIFYGDTWDVRSVPDAKNVAYTSQELDFHMDLMYLDQPPHLQFLHCMRSSAAGGASLFADSYKATADLFKLDLDAFFDLSNLTVSFHYNHAPDHLYHRDRRVLQLKPLPVDSRLIHLGGIASDFKKTAQGAKSLKSFERLTRVLQPFKNGEERIEDYIESMAWSPPFQAPFHSKVMRPRSPLLALNKKVSSWHRAAAAFNNLIHRKEVIHERLMKPGECVIFDNRRVLHARKAFEVGDQGKERWLRGCYVDRDPYWSKMRVLGERFGAVKE